MLSNADEPSVDGDFNNRNDFDSFEPEKQSSTPTQRCFSEHHFFVYIMFLFVMFRKRSYLRYKNCHYYVTLILQILVLAV